MPEYTGDHSYPVTQPLNIGLRFVNPYFIPEPGASLTLRFGATGDTAILSGNSEIQIIMPGGLVSVIIEILPKKSEILLSGNTHIIDLIYIVRSALSEIRTESAKQNVEHVHIIVNALSEILLASNVQEIGAIDFIVSALSEILLSSNVQDFEVLTELQPGLSEILLKLSEQTVEHLPDVVNAITDIISVFGSKIIGGGQPNDLPNKLGHSGFNMSWQKTKHNVHIDFNSAWDDPIDTRLRNKMPWKKPNGIEAGIKAPFRPIMDLLNDHVKKPWGDFMAKPDMNFSVPYIVTMDFIDKATGAEWGGLITRDKHILNSYKNSAYWDASFKDRHFKKSWDMSFNMDHHKRNSFENDMLDQIRDKRHGTYWGPFWYSLFCQEKYFPYLEDEDIKLVLKTDVPILNNPDFLKPNNPRCPFDYWYSGGRGVNTPVINPIDTLITERRKKYYMINSAFIKRLPSNESIAFEAVNISTDRNSWTWSFDITLSSKDYLNLIKPSGNTLVDVEININGWKWTCRVENWRETISFGKRAWSVSGRSPSVELGEPYLIEPSFANNQANGGQIINDILEHSGWTADWQYDSEFDPFTEWLIPASVLNLYDSSKIKQMQSVIEAVSAFIQTVPDTNSEKKFIIRPRYKKNPWAWNSITPSVILNDAVCHEIGRENNIIRPVNSVIITGENHGVTVSATRDGTAGDMPAPMEISSLITTAKAGRERARHVIGNSGFWINHSMRLFSLMPPGQAPGLLLPGDFMQMQEVGLSSWMGQVTGVGISAAWSNGLIVSQQLEVEQFHG